MCCSIISMRQQVDSSHCRVASDSMYRQIRQVAVPLCFFFDADIPSTGRLIPAMSAFRRLTSPLRIVVLLALGFLVRLLFSPSAPTTPSQSHQIKEHNFIERATRPDKSLNPQKHPFLQARVGRDEREDIFNGLVYEGIMDYWTRLQLPLCVVHGAGYPRLIQAYQYHEQGHRVQGCPTCVQCH